MRTLERNKTKLWYVAPATEIDNVDGSGFYTGETTLTYSTPVAIFISLYPSDGEVVDRIFGKDASLDMMAVSNDVVMVEEGLLFINEPSDDYDTTYDYRISVINKSLNTYNYGLRNKT